jgi:tetratricopeptide (TPR) repeat protein
LELSRLIGDLNRYSLLTGVSSDGVAVHRLVQSSLREQLDPERWSMWAGTAVRLVAAAFPEKIHDTTTWAACARLVPHVKASTDLARSRGIEFESSLRVLPQAASYLENRGDFFGARGLLETAVEIAEEAHEPEHQEVARILDPLGFVLRDLGDQDGARATLERALNIYFRASVSKGADVASTLAKLAYVYWDSPEPYHKVQATGMFERAVRLYQDAHGADDLDVAKTLTGLGQALLDLEEMTQAIACQQRALGIFISHHGLDDVDVARTFDKLGYAVGFAGDPRRAARLHRLALDIFSRTYGSGPAP